MNESAAPTEATPEPSKPTLRDLVNHLLARDALRAETLRTECERLAAAAGADPTSETVRAALLARERLSEQLERQRRRQARVSAFVCCVGEQYARVSSN